MFVKQEFILNKIQENPELRFWDIYSPNKSLVDTCDNEQFTNLDAYQKIVSAFEALTGTYIVKVRSKSKKSTGAGGDTKTVTFEYQVNLGGASGSVNTPIAGTTNVNHLEALYAEKNNSTTNELNHKFEIFKKDLEIADLKEKLKKKAEDSGSGLDKMMVGIIAQHAGLDPSLFMPSFPKPIIPATHIHGTEAQPNNATHDQESPNERRLRESIIRLNAVNPPPASIDLVENIAITLEMYPTLVDTFNKFFKEAAAGVPLADVYANMMK